MYHWYTGYFVLNLIILGQIIALFYPFGNEQERINSSIFVAVCHRTCVQLKINPKGYSSRIILEVVLVLLWVLCPCEIGFRNWGTIVLKEWIVSAVAHGLDNCNRELLPLCSLRSNYYHTDNHLWCSTASTLLLSATSIRAFPRFHSMAVKSVSMWLLFCFCLLFIPDIRDLFLLLDAR